MKLIARLALLALGAVAAPALTQTQPYNTAILTWTIVNSYDDFAPIIESVTYSVYAGKEGATRTRVAADIKTNTATRTNIPDGTWCWHVVAVVKGIEGKPSEPVCKKIQKVASNVPGQVTGLSVL